MTRLESLRKELLDAEDKVRSLKEKIRLADIDQLRRDFLSAGYHEDGEAWDYIKALEACRPWVIRSKSTGVLARRLGSGDISLYSTKEIADKDRKDTGRTHEWEVVQWEGNL